MKIKTNKVEIRVNFLFFTWIYYVCIFITLFLYAHRSEPVNVSTRFIFHYIRFHDRFIYYYCIVYRRHQIPNISASIFIVVSTPTLLDFPFYFYFIIYLLIWCHFFPCSLHWHFVQHHCRYIYINPERENDGTSKMHAHMKLNSIHLKKLTI